MATPHRTVEKRGLNWVLEQYGKGEAMAENLPGTRPTHAGSQPIMVTAKVSGLFLGLILGALGFIGGYAVARDVRGPESSQTSVSQGAGRLTQLTTPHVTEETAGHGAPRFTMAAVQGATYTEGNIEGIEISHPGFVVVGDDETGTVFVIERAGFPRYKKVIPGGH